MNTFFVYILTNRSRNILFTGITMDLKSQLEEHLNPPEDDAAFTPRDQTCYLIYYEEYKNLSNALAREKQMKSWSMQMKMLFIKASNPLLMFLNTPQDPNKNSA